MDQAHPQACQQHAAELIRVPCRHRRAVRAQALHIEQGKLDLVLDAKGSLLEGPLWDKRTSKLLLVDCEDPHIHIFDPASCKDDSDRQGLPGGGAGAIGACCSLATVRMHRSLNVGRQAGIADLTAEV